MDILDLINAVASTVAVGLMVIGLYRLRFVAASDGLWSTVTVWLLAALAWLVASCADLLASHVSGWLSVGLVAGCLAVSWLIAGRAARADGAGR